jgi:cytochrome c biogenesis protein CcdA
MGIVEAASLITAFLAGGAALFAPCCVGVLLPSYLASIFQTRTKIFLMTFVYFLGLLTVFLPLGLGFASLGGLFRDNHTVIFAAGGLFMVALGVSLVLGKSMMLPLHIRPKLSKQANFWSLYVLGIFSGIATSCCAPVLAGVMALTVLPGSWILGGVYSLAFVIGMVLPLFIVASFIDRTKALEKFQILKRKVQYNFFGHRISLHLSSLVSGILYIAVGGLILYFGSRGPEALSDAYQLNINIWTAEATQAVSKVTGGIPQDIWAILFVGVFILIAWLAYRQAKKESTNNNKEI